MYFLDETKCFGKNRTRVSFFIMLVIKAGKRMYPQSLVYTRWVSNSDTNRR